MTTSSHFIQPFDLFCIWTPCHACFVPCYTQHTRVLYLRLMFFSTAISIRQVPGMLSFHSHFHLWGSHLLSMYWWKIENENENVCVFFHFIFYFLRSSSLHRESASIELQAHTDCYWAKPISIEFSNSFASISISFCIHKCMYFEIELPTVSTSMIFLFILFAFWFLLLNTMESLEPFFFFFFFFFNVISIAKWKWSETDFFFLWMCGGMNR